MIVPVKNFVNESYCRDISIKSRSNQQAKRMNGDYIGAFVCYGYRKDEQDKNKIVPDEEAARWTPKAVLRILSNGINIGVLEQGKREKVSYKVKKTIEKPKSAWVRVNLRRWQVRRIQRQGMQWYRKLQERITDLK